MFVRNLAYACREEDLQQLFEKFGPITEVSIPVDAESKKSKAIGFVTFLMPEHAVRAYSELDGTTFQVGTLARAHAQCLSVCML